MTELLHRFGAEDEAARHDDPARYRLIPSPQTEGGFAMQCRRCGMTTYHPEDIKNRYCGYCSEFLDD